MITNAQGAGSTLFLLFVCFLFLFCFTDSPTSEGCFDLAKGETETFCAVQRHPLVYLSKNYPASKCARQPS